VCVCVCMTGGPCHHISGDGASIVTAMGRVTKGGRERKDGMEQDGDGNAVAVRPHDTERGKG
jgi:hypothetical protein